MPEFDSLPSDLNIAGSCPDQLKALNEHAIVSITDAQGIIVHANDLFCSVSGYSRDELLGKKHNIIKSGVHDADFYRGMWETITQGKSWHGQVCNRNKAGQLYWVQSSITPILNDTGDTRYYISVRTEITAQKETELHLSAMLNAGNVALALLDTQGTIVDCNDTLAQFANVPRSSLLHQPIQSFANPEAQPGLERMLVQLNSHTDNFNQEYLMTDGQGGITEWADAMFHAIRNPDGALMGISSSLVNITERKVLLEQLRRTLAEQEGVFRVAPMGISVLDQRRITQCNPMFEQMLGYDSGELLGHTTRTLYLSDEQYQELGRIAYEPIMQGKVAHFETQLRRKDGSVLWVAAATSSLSPHDPYNHTIYTLTDITEQKLQAAALEQAKIAAETAARAKTQLLNNITHELRTPLNAILGFTQVLEFIEEGEATPPGYQENVQYISQAGQHLLKMVDSVIELASLDVFDKPLQGQPVPLVEVVERALLGLKSLAAHKHIGVRWDRTQCGEILLSTDQLRLTRIFALVLDNAIRYNHQDGAVWLEVREHDARCVIEIHDSGIGMTAEQVARLPEPFVRFTEDGERPSGGLGMTLVYRLAAVLGIGIQVESTLGTGTTVTLDIPVATFDDL